LDRPISIATGTATSDNGRRQGVPELAHRPHFTTEERQVFARRRIGLPMALFSALLVAYVGQVVLVLALPTPLAVLMCVPCGLVIGMLFVVGHDAGHNSLTRSRRLNQVLGRLAFLPSLHAFSLWDLSHNRLHHRYNNIRGLDVAWEPMSPADYQRCGSLRRSMYRLWRTPVGVASYYLIGHWAPRLLLPLPHVVGGVRLVYCLDSVLVLAGLAVQVYGAIALGGVFGKGAWESVMEAVALPFLVWNGFISFVIFLHHTHPAIRWYPDEAAWRAEQGGLQGTVCVRFPFPFAAMALGIMEHNAHHTASDVPLYNLSRMQRSLEDRTGLVTWRFSWRGYARICRRCKLYDYVAAKWVSYDGRAG
jgi:omega-6 fatty acid desaturase (delta-12 desaturase)